MIPKLFLAAFIFVAIWEIAWKGLALWQSARHKQISWFVCILIFNTVGILPITYLFFFQPKSKRK